MHVDLEACKCDCSFNTNWQLPCIHMKALIEKSEFSIGKCHYNLLIIYSDSMKLPKRWCRQYVSIEPAQEPDSFSPSSSFQPSEDSIMRKSLLKDLVNLERLNPVRHRNLLHSLKNIIDTELKDAEQEDAAVSSRQPIF